MTQCWVCGNDNAENQAFCGTCGAKIEAETSSAPPTLAPTGDEGAVAEAPGTEDAGSAAPPPMEGEDPGTAPSGTDDTGSSDSGSTEDGGMVPIAMEDMELTPTPKAGYLVFPDNSEQPIPPSQWLIGRADLAKYIPDPEKANEISRGHFTVFQEGEKFFVEDGKTMVQEKASSNKTWLVRGGSKILVTGTGRNELQDDDEIDVAELVKLQFIEK